MATELKPCPFCGGKAKIVGLRAAPTIFYVLCSECHAEICYSIHDDDLGSRIIIDPNCVRNAAIEAWNRRAEDG